MKTYLKEIKDIIIFIITLLIFSFLFMLLWNDAMPNLFRLPNLSFYQSLEILILSNLLFKSNNCNKI